LLIHAWLCALSPGFHFGNYRFSRFSRSPDFISSFERSGKNSAASREQHLEYRALSPKESTVLP